MKGLKQYLRKHGNHFTEALVKDYIPTKWDYPEIEKSIKDEVWYNCWSATKGDMLYLVNIAHIFSGSNKRLCIMFMLGVVGDYEHREWFDMWVKDNEDFDLTPYV